jgi:hypothetical protein
LVCHSFQGLFTACGIEQRRGPVLNLAPNGGGLERQRALPDGVADSGGRHIGSAEHNHLRTSQAADRFAQRSAR